MKILFLDIETSPITAYTWGLWKQNISNDKILDTGGVLCWSAKWHGERSINFDSVHASRRSAMLRRIHRLLDETDVAVTYFGDRFDLPMLAKEFAVLGLPPPAPFKSIDLCTVVQRRFQFASSKLDFVCKALKIGAKVRHTGFELWVQCMGGDAKAWTLMEKYNRHDVTILERLYDRILPWIPNHPNRAAFDEDPDACPRCGAGPGHYQRRGTAIMTTLRYRRYQCMKCGGWFRQVFRNRGTRANVVSA